MSDWSFLKRATALKLHSPTATAPSPDGKGPAASLPLEGTPAQFTTYVRDSAIITDLRSWGFQVAGESHANPDVLRTVIGWLFRNQLNVDDEIARRERERVKQLKAEIAGKQTALEKVEAESAHLARSIEDLGEAERQKREDIERVRGGDSSFGATAGHADRFAFYLSIGILVFLSIYLFLFYISAIYNAFLFDPASAQREAITSGRQLVATIFNGAALGEAWRQGIMTFVFVAAAPSLILALGFLIHHFSEEGRMMPVYLLLAVTFLLDALLAYAIVSEMYEVRYLTGLEAEPWHTTMVFSRPAFYIILFAGFLAYIIWGLILKYALSSLERSRPGAVAIRRIQAELERIREKRNALRDKAQATDQRRISLEGEVRSLVEQSAAAERGEASFQRHVEELMHGWLSYITGAFGAKGPELSREAMHVRNDAVERLLAKVPA